ncbi:MAG: hypothetical protein AAFQ55_17755 [Pseudomonadota bacterium]
MRVKVWNEHVKLVVTLFNAVSIGVLGVAVIGPLTQPRNPFFGVSDKLAGLETNKLADINDFLITVAWYNVVEWWAVGAALILHLIAHLITRAQIDE